ncbi:MAG: tetratricopeptide repeat protein [Balneolaceae bacterium]
MKSQKTLLLFSLMFVLLLGVAQTVMAQDEERTQAVRLYNEAQELAGSSQYQDAIDVYRDALEIARENQFEDIIEFVEERLPRVYANRASDAYREYQSQRTLGSVDTALEYFQLSREAADEFNNTQIAQQAASAIPQLYYIRSILNFRQENLSEAMDDLDAALELNPNYAAAYYQKGIVQKQMTPNDVDAFIQWYDQAIAVASQVNDNRTLESAQEGARDELIYRAVNLSQERRFDPAVNLLNRVENYDPRSVDAQYRLAEISNLRGNWSTAETHARRALDYHTGGVADKAKIYFELGTALKGQGNFDSACSAFENARYGDFTGPADHELQFELKCEGHTSR